MTKFHPQLDQNFGYAHLKNTAILQAEGADAATFLQGQLSQDIAKLKNQDSCFAGLSNPKGRLIASTYVYRLSGECFYLLLPSDMLTEVQTQLTKYVMRSKVKFSISENLHVYGLWNAQAEHFSAFSDYIKLAEHADLYYAISQEKLEKDLEDNLQNESQWTLQKILNVIPEVSAATQERFVAQMLNMDVLNGISFHKGCYTGQEVIARMQHLGRIKRRTLLIESDTALATGEKIQHTEKAIGEVVNSIATNSTHEDKHYALAVVQLDKLKAIDADDLLKHSGLKMFEPDYALEQKV